MTTKDYTIKVIDSEGRRLSLSINGDSVDELIRVYGDSEEYAREQVESNTVENAIHRGEIGSEVYLESE